MQSDLGLLILRLVLGLLFLGHGSQKLFGWFEGPGLTGTAGMTRHFGFHPAGFWGFMAAISEFGGGLLTLLGLLSPLGSLGIIAAMLIAILKVHWPKGFWNTKGGFEFPLMNLTAALALGLTGPGAFSLDAALGIRLPEPASLIIGLILVLLGVLGAYLSHAFKPAEAPSTTSEQPRTAAK